MDLKGLDGSTWRGFSDQELHKLKVTPSLNVDPAIRPHSHSDDSKLQLIQRAPEQDEGYSLTGSSGPEKQSCDLVEPELRLEEQEKRQRELEEENNRKRLVLENALMERYQASRVEADKLQRVRDELKTLELLVTRDVSILRERIETASRDYSQAKSQFEHAEKEYMSAKLKLATCREKKELLSQHLCAVIRETESRKALKLSLLMNQLDIQEPTML